MSAHRTSILWKISKEELEKIVEKSTSISQILSHFKLENKGNNFRTLKKLFISLNINYEHISSKSVENRNRGLRVSHVKIPLDEILIEGSSYNRNRLKKRLISNGLLKNVCSVCNMEPIWNNKKLILQLDHINGISDDNRLENLRLLCPNCHSQTDTFAGKKNKKIKMSIL